MKRGKWTQQEDSLVLKIMKERQLHNPDETNGLPYHLISSKYLPHRSSKQIKERWENVLNPKLKKGKWSFEEIRQLFELLAKYGQSWSQIHAELGSRSFHCIKSKGRYLLGEIIKPHGKSAKGSKSSPARTYLTAEEETKLLKLHEKYGYNTQKICEELIFKMSCADIERKLLSLCKCDSCKEIYSRLNDGSKSFKTAWTQEKAKTLLAEHMQGNLAEYDDLDDIAFDIQIPNIGQNIKNEDSSENIEEEKIPLDFESKIGMENVKMSDGKARIKQEPEDSSDNLQQSNSFSSDVDLMRGLSSLNLEFDVAENGYNPLENNEKAGNLLNGYDGNMSEIEELDTELMQMESFDGLNLGRENNFGILDLDTVYEDLLGDHDVQEKRKREDYHVDAIEKKIRSLKAEEVQLTLLEAARTVGRNGGENRSFRNVIARVMSRFYSKDQLLKFCKAAEDSKIEWFSPSIAYLLDQTVKDGKDARYDLDFCFPQSASFDRNKPVGTFLYDHASCICVDENRDVADSLQLTTHIGNHWFENQPSILHATYIFTNMIPRLMEEGEVWIHQRQLKTDGKEGIFLVRVAFKGNICRFDYQEVSEKYQGLLRLQNELL